MKLWIRTGKNGGVGTEYVGVSSYNLDDVELRIEMLDGGVIRFPQHQVFSVTEVPNA